MSSDPLPLPEIWSDLPEGDAYESTRTEFAANGRSGLVLIEYASGFAQSDPQPAVRPPERAEQPAANERMPSLAPAALAKGLADLTAIVTHAEALLRAQGTLKGDVYFAVERIHDVAMALRMRDVDSALCDTLDDSVREVGDAVVRHEAAATGALSAAGLLRDVMRRIEDLAVVASHMIASEGDALVRPWAGESETAIEVAAVMTEAEAAIEPLAPVVTEAEVVSDMPLPVATETESAIDALRPVVSEPEAAIAARADELSTDPRTEIAHAPEAEIAHGPEAEATDAPVTPPVILGTDDDQTRSLLYITSDAVTSGDVSVRETQAIAEPTDGVAGPAESPAAMAWHPQQDPLQGDVDVAAEMPEDKDEAASVAVAIEAANMAPAVESESEGIAIEVASASTALEADTSEVPVTHHEQEPAQVASSAGESVSAAATKPRRPANDPLAVLYGLSEEELIALFS